MGHEKFSTLRYPSGPASIREDKIGFRPFKRKNEIVFYAFLAHVQKNQGIGLC